MHTHSTHQIITNEITLHYIEYAQNGNTIICMHGITGNCHAFDGLVAKGLNEYHRVISVDLRGRGLSDHPAFHYSMDEHAKDIIGLLDHLQIDKAILMGHSFGGLLSCFLAANYPDRVQRLIILDAAAELNADVIEMLAPAFGRLDKKFASWEEYIDMIKAAPYMNFWSDEMLSYYKADVMDTDEGGVTPRSNLTNIIHCSLGVSNEAWSTIMPRINQPALLLNALDVYTLGQPLLPEYKAQETVAMMKDCKYLTVDGNHHTMMYGDGAKQIVDGVNKFLS